MHFADAERMTKFLFQSAPGREAGRCPRNQGGGMKLIGFNPRPAVRPGDAWPARGCFQVGTGFNPRPAVRPGDAEAVRHPINTPESFNPRPAVRPGDATKATSA